MRKQIQTVVVSFICYFKRFFNLGLNDNYCTAGWVCFRNDSGSTPHPALRATLSLKGRGDNTSPFCKEDSFTYPANHYEYIFNVRSIFLLITLFIESYSVCNASCSVSNLFKRLSYCLSFASISRTVCWYSTSALVIAASLTCSVISVALLYIIDVHVTFASPLPSSVGSV